MSDLIMIGLEGDEDWREYDFSGRVYRINKPVSVYFKRGGETHRVIDSEGVCHIVPAPGSHECVVRFSGKIIA